MSGKTSQRALSAAISQGILGSPSLTYEPGKPKHAGLFYDLDEFESGLDRAEEAFGKDVLHAIAVKANPVSAMLKIILKKGHGLECASITEVLHGMDLGFPPEKIVFDSPVKTEPELKFALENGIHVNVDNYQELERITAIINDQGQTKSSVGIRLKPILGVGAVKALSTCTADSKFGVQLTDSSKEEIIGWYLDRPWLTAVHIHIGSQSYDCSDLTCGVKCVVDFALEVNGRLGKKQIHTIDIGGGLPANLENDTTRPSFQDYAETLKKEVPELFPSYGAFKKVITEFGQAFNAKAGWLVSRVEYTKKASDNLKIVLIHFGADMMTRTCYCPNVQKYQRRVEVFSEEGQLKEGERMRYNIAGPLCFSGDVVKRDVLLPTVEEGDYLILHDCGANSLSLFSRHCSRQAPAVLGRHGLDDLKTSVLLKPRCFNLNVCEVNRITWLFFSSVMSFDFQQHTLLFGRLFASRSSKSPDSYHAIIPIYVDICPAIISVENTKASGKSQLKSFTYSSVLLYMEEKLTCFVESSGSFFKRLISNAAAQSSKKSTTFAVDVRWENECEGCKINKPRFWLAGSLVDDVLG